MSSSPRRSARRRWLAAVLAVATAVCGSLAVLTLPRASSVQYVRWPVSDAAILVAETGISGVFRDSGDSAGFFDSIRDHLPPYRLHWDGQPPRAFLIDARTDEILGPPVLSRKTLLLNRNAVLWTPEQCGFVISRTLYDANRQHLAVKFEVPAPRGTFYAFFVLGSVLFALTWLVYFGHSLLFIGTDGPRARFVGWVQAIVLLLAAALLFPIHFPGYPLSASMGDEANVNSFAAAFDRPDVFQRDQLLSEPRNFDWYTPLYVQWVRLFQWIGFRYDTNRSFAVFFSALVGLVGYQRLFGTLSGSPWFGFIAALCLWFLKTMIPPTEAWGALFASPRTVISALFPWALLFAIGSIDRPARWWLPAALTGLLFYVHPVSSPAVTGAVLTGFLVAGREPWRARLWHVTVATAAAVAVMIPYGLVYTRKYAQTIIPDPELGDRILQYAAARFGQGYLDLPFFFSQLGAFLIQGRRYWLGAAAIILLVPFFRRSRLVQFYFGVLAGWLTVTLFVPFVDLTIAKRLHTLPFQLDLIRNVKWMDALGLTAVALLLGEWRRSRPQPEHERSAQPLASRLRRHAVPVMAMLAVVFCYARVLYPDLYSMTAMDLRQLNALQGRYTRPALYTMEVINAVHALRREGERVFGPLPFRQMYIPLSFVQKDTGALGYSNPNGLVRASASLVGIIPYTKPPMSLSDVGHIARITDTQMVVLKRHLVDPTLLESDTVLFQNPDSVVLRIPATAVADGAGNAARNARAPVPPGQVQ